MTATALLLGLVLLQASPGTFTIGGTVVDAITGRPVAKAKVLVASTNARLSKTAFVSGADGRFHFDGLAAGKYSLSAERLGYPTQIFGQRTLYARYTSAIVVAAEQKTDAIVFKLVRGGVITGKVAEPDGEPVAGLTVTALQVVGIGQGRRVARVFASSTDDRGVYRIAFLCQGKFAVVVTGKPHQQEARVSTSSLAYPVTYFPGSNDPSGAALVEVRPGQESRADVTVARLPAARLVAQVPGDMAAKRYLFLSTPALYGYKISYGPSHWVTRNQVIVADLPPGRYVMNLVQEGTRRGGWQPVDVVAPETQVSMGENPPAAVTANVTIAGRPGSGGDVTVGLISLDSQSNLPQTAFAKGSAVFDAVPPGRYTPSVYLNRAQAAVVEMKARGAAVAPGLVLTVPETGAVELDLTVDGEAVVLNGKVMCDSGPCAGALAMLVKRTGWELAGPFRFDQSDSDGSFSWKAVPPGEYMMFAFENADPLDYDDPQVIRHLLTGAQALTVRGGDTREIVLALTGTAAK